MRVARCRRVSLGSLCVGGVLLCGGCGPGKGLAGTWVLTDMPGRDGVAIDAPVGAITFEEEGTYTSYVDYDGGIVTAHGEWERAGERGLSLRADRGSRRYEIVVDGMTLEMSGLRNGQRTTSVWKRFYRW